MKHEVVLSIECITKEFLQVITAKHNVPKVNAKHDWKRLYEYGKIQINNRHSMFTK